MKTAAEVKMTDYYENWLNDRQQLRQKVNSYYRTQNHRIAIGNQIIDNWKKNTGQDTSKEMTDAEVQKAMAKIKKEYRLITENIANPIAELTMKVKEEINKMYPKFDFRNPIIGLTELMSRGKLKKLIETNKNLAYSPGIIYDTHQLIKADQFVSDRRYEDAFVLEIKEILPRFKLWDWLNSNKGIGPVMGGVLITRFNPFTGVYPSSYICYAGLDVVHFFDPEGNVTKIEGRGKKKGHLVPRTYTNSKGKVIETTGISHCPFLKSKLIGVLAGSFMMTKNPDYSPIYYNEKVKYLNNPKYAGTILKKGKEVPKTPLLHIHRMATRKMLKAFIYEYYIHDKRSHGLIEYPPYEEEKYEVIHNFRKNQFLDAQTIAESKRGRAIGPDDPMEKAA